MNWYCVDIGIVFSIFEKAPRGISGCADRPPLCVSLARLHPGAVLCSMVPGVRWASRALVIELKGGCTQ